MDRSCSIRWCAVLTALCGCGSVTVDPAARPSAGRAAVASQVRVPGDDLVFASNGNGVGRTLTPDGTIDTSGPFFQSLGTNGRACVSCHVASDGWTITPGSVQRRFEATSGLDPLFRPNDGATSPLADVSSLDARRNAYALLLDRALIRVGLPIPDGAEFELAAVDDPYGYASAKELSLFRRPLPAANLRFLSAVMWDGRETFAGTTIHQDLADQANAATQGHAQKTDPLTDAEREEIVAFESGLTFAQTLDFAAGVLDQDGARGGPVALASTPFYLGINDALGGDPEGLPFDPVAMTLFAPWSGLDGSRRDQARAAIARGEDLFNHKPIAITGVRGLNDQLGVPTIAGTCTTCHDTPNVGNHSVAVPLDLGLTDAARRTPDLPLYTLRNKATGETFQTTDPGRALITGRWSDLGRFKGPILRGLSARPPYFHNGSARTLLDVVEFYDSRFRLGFSAQDKADLTAFLASL